jgi:hypothetical protein
VSEAELSRLPGMPASGHLYVPAVFWMGELVYDDTPPSLNEVGSRGDHWAYTAQKKQWQATLEQAMMVAKVPRDRASQAWAGARMRFPKPNTRRDSGNFSMMIEKALGDGLSNYRAIPDDTAEQFYFAGVEFERERGPNRTTIVLWLRE